MVGGFCPVIIKDLVTGRYPNTLEDGWGFLPLHHQGPSHGELPQLSGEIRGVSPFFYKGHNGHDYDVHRVDQDQMTTDPVTGGFPNSLEEWGRLPRYLQGT